MAVDYLGYPHQGIRNLTPYTPGKSIKEVVKEKGLTDIIKLASNENPLGCSPVVTVALAKLDRHDIATYPSPFHHELLPCLAKHLNINETHLFVSNGSDLIFGHLLSCFALHTDKHLLTHEYAFSAYEIQAQAMGVSVHKTAVQNWAPDIKALLASCKSDTGLLILANPNNPTGVLLPQEDILHLIENTPKETILVIDEAYYEYAHEHSSVDLINLLPNHPNLVITRTFSKAYGLAGVRLGYAIAHPTVIELLKRLQLPFTVNQVALSAGEAALSDQAFIAQTLDANREGMEQILQGLKTLSFTSLPSYGNFITFDCRQDGMVVYEKLLDKGIIVRPLHPYKMNEWIRVTIGTKEQNTRFLEALGEIYHEQ